MTKRHIYNKIILLLPTPVSLSLIFIFILLKVPISDSNTIFVIYFNGIIIDTIIELMNVLGTTPGNII